MQLLPIEKLGPREVAGQPGVVRFGLFLPWVYAVHGNRLFLKTIHEQDQFLQQIQPFEFELSHRNDLSLSTMASGERRITNENFHG